MFKDAQVEKALEYAIAGFPVFPVYEPNDEGACTCDRLNCSQVGKHPRTPNGFKDATLDVDTVRAFWKQWPNANIGIPTGAVSGIVVLDVDAKSGGLKSLEILVAQNGKIANAVVSNTGGGGKHIFFKNPEYPLPNKVGVLPGIDVRGDGGYVIVPPSKHKSGKIYFWEAK